MFESLSDRFQEIIQNTARVKELTQDNMKEALREIRRSLLGADVNLRVVKSFISNIKDKAEGEDIIKGVNPSQQLIKIVHDELIDLLGKENKPLDFSGNRVYNIKVVHFMNKTKQMRRTKNEFQNFES